jgi:hypothetical protein
VNATLPLARWDDKGIHVPNLTTQDLATACGLFLKIAYPDGAATIPANKLAYERISPDEPIEAFLPPANVAQGICQDLSKTKAGIPGYEFRLGSKTFPHLKLRIQTMEFHDRQVWVYSVDTHDQFHSAAQHLPPEEAEHWRTIVEQNRKDKQQIEDALSKAGFLTPKSLLKLDLSQASPR